MAATIGDPVKRLRFLKAMAPAELQEQQFSSRWRSLRRAGLVAFAGIATVISFFIARAGTRIVTPVPARAASSLPRPAVPVNLPRIRPSAEVWQVEGNRKFELYSNGLRIDNIDSPYADVPQLYATIAGRGI